MVTHSDKTFALKNCVLLQLSQHVLEIHDKVHNNVSY
jgi:hypothetical protein